MTAPAPRDAVSGEPWRFFGLVARQSSMQTKLAKLKARAAAGDWAGALSIAAKFPRLGEHAAAIQKAHECLVGGADFYRQCGKDPDALIAAGIEALKTRYKLGSQP